MPASASKSARRSSTFASSFAVPAGAAASGSAASSLPHPASASAARTRTAARRIRPDLGRGAVERVERGADRHPLADEDRRVALGVGRRLALAQRQHQVHEVGRLVALERGHELLVVDPERVRRVVVDRLELAADADVLVHRPLPVLERERVPRPHLHERVDDEVRRPLRDDLPRPAGLGVRRGLRRREVVVRRLQPAGERRPVQRRAELAEVGVALGDLPEEEVDVGADARGRVGAQVLEAVAPALDDVCERVLHRGPLLERQPPPGRVGLEEGVGDVLARLGSLLTGISYVPRASRTGSRLDFAVPSA